jgi:soluble lytic murein transglycosylase-like protein
MDIFSDISAIQNRIAEITGAPPAGAPLPMPGQFSTALAQALGPQQQQAVDPSAATDAPAPVPPEQIDALVQQNASIWQVDPALIKSVIANESSFNANATSPVGAQGLMQLMPETAASLGVKNPYDPAQNVAGGTRYLRGLLDRFNGDTKLAVAAYNAGPGAVEKYNGVPPYAETQSYVQNVLGSFDRYKTQQP